MSKMDVLGESKKLRYDDDLAGKLNKDFEKRLKMEEKEKRTKKNDTPQTILLEDFILEMQPADACSTHVYHEWVEYYDEVNNGMGASRVMASMADFYAAFKQAIILEKSDIAFRKAHANAFITGIRSILQGSAFANYDIMTNTRLRYGRGSDIDSLNHAEMIHHYATQAHELRKEYVSGLPGMPLDIKELFDISPLGTEYLTCLFDAETDTAETIMSTLEYISGFNRNKIMIFVEDIDSRASRPDRNVVLRSMNGNGFCIDATYNVDKSIMSDKRSYTYGRYIIKGIEAQYD